MLNISPQSQQTSPLHLGRCSRRRSRQFITFSLERLHLQQASVPALFQTGSNKTVVGIDRIILPMRTSRFEPRLLERQVDLPPLFSVVGSPLIERVECRLNPKRLQTVDHFGADRTINTHPAERNAAISAMIEVTAATVIAPGVAASTAVSNVQLAAAMAAAQQPGQQRFATAHRAAAVETLAVGIVTDQALVPLEIRPANVAPPMLSAPCGSP